MRRRTILTALTCTAFVLAGCSDQGPTDLSNTGEPQLREAEVLALTSSNPSILDLRMQSDELLREPARTLARFALAKVQLDINQNRPTLYASSLMFAAIPLVERRLNRIPEEKVGRLIDLLCTLQKLIGPKLPPTSRLNTIPWCDVEPEELGNESQFQLVTNANGATVKTSTDQLSLNIAANSLADANGNPVPSALITILPIQRRDPTVEASHPCPQPFDPRYAGRDCYPEFYEIRSQPLVQFVNTPAFLQVCQLDPHSSSPDAPSHSVLARLQLFAKSAGGAIALLPKFIEGEELPAVNTLACDGDEDLHDDEEPIGVIGFSRDGARNAWLALARLGSRALDALGPKTLYATNVPTHGAVRRELIDFAGTVVGAIDLSDPTPSNTLINGDFEQPLATGWTSGGTQNFSVTRVENTIGSAAQLAVGDGPSTGLACENASLNNFAFLDQSFTLTKNQTVELDVRVPLPQADDDTENTECSGFDRTSVIFTIQGTSGPSALGFMNIDFTPVNGVTGHLQVNDFVANTVSSTSFDPTGFDNPVSVGPLTIRHSSAAGWIHVSYEVSTDRFSWLPDNVSFRVSLRNEDNKQTNKHFALLADDVGVRPIVIIP